MAAASDHARLPPDVTATIATLRNQGPHGGPFDYRSILTDVLGWVMERAAGARLAELISRELWQPMGAEFDAEVTVDGHGNAMADGGVCVTLRDLARFGQLLANGGRRGARSVVPQPWIRDTLTPEPDSVEAFAASADAIREVPTRRVLPQQVLGGGPRHPDLHGLGDQRAERVRPRAGANVVIAKLSTWPVAWEDQIARDTRNAMIQLAEALV